MTIDISKAAAFMATHARTLDRRRFAFLFDHAEPATVVKALDAYRNTDGGYGWGLEPDLRSASSQPAGALHAFEVFDEIAPAIAFGPRRPATASQAAELCDWLGSVSLPDGGLPFALRIDDPAGCAPFWAGANPDESSLHITTAVAGMAHRVARHDRAVAGHPWLSTVTRYCMESIRATTEPAHALELLYVLHFLDAVSDTEPEAVEHIRRLGAAIPPSGEMHVGGGLEDEMQRALDFAPEPDRPLRRLFTPEAIEQNLDRLAGLQSEDGGWPNEWASYSPAAPMEWRGYLTVRAISILRANGRAG